MGNSRKSIIYTVVSFLALLLLTVTSYGQWTPWAMVGRGAASDTVWNEFNPATVGTYMALSNGDQTATKTSNICSRASTTIAPSTGKRYIECRSVVGAIGITNTIKTFSFSSGNSTLVNSCSANPTYYIYFVLFNTDISLYDQTGLLGTWAIGTYASGDTAMFAMDFVNGALYVGWDGLWKKNSSGVTGDPTSGASRTGAIYTWTPDGRQYEFVVGGSGLPEYYTENSGQDPWVYGLPDTTYTGIYISP